MDWLDSLRAEGERATRLATDLEFFATERLKIRPKAGSLAPFVFNNAQRALHRRLEEQKAKTGRVRAIVLKARQMGISTYVAARFYKATPPRQACERRSLATKSQQAETCLHWSSASMKTCRPSIANPSARRTPKS